MSQSALDDIDRRIIDLLIDDCRMSLRALGNDVGLTAPAVRDRILRLEDTGIIEAFSVRLNARALGFLGKLQAVEHALRDIPEIVDCVVVTGEDCFVARFVLKDVGDLDRLLGPLHYIARTKTSIVHRKPIPPRRPPF